VLRAPAPTPYDDYVIHVWVNKYMYQGADVQGASRERQSAHTVRTKTVQATALAHQTQKMRIMCNVYRHGL
jgi:hypothetical protein